MEFKHVTWALTTVVVLFKDLNASKSWESLSLSSRRMTVTIGEIVLEAVAWGIAMLNNLLYMHI